VFPATKVKKKFSSGYPVLKH